MAELSDRIASILSSEPTSKAAADLLEAVKAETDRIATRREEVRAEAVDPLTPAATLKKRRGEIVDLEFDAERLGVAVGRLQEALEQARGRERQATRQEAYEAAAKAMAAAGQAISTRWDALAAEMRDLLVAGVEAVKAVTEANAALPEGAAPLDVHPTLVGWVPATPERIVSERKVTLWTIERSGVIVDEDRLEPGGDRRKVKGTTNHYAVRRSFREVEFIPAKDLQRNPAMYEIADIPSCIAGAPAYWEKGRNDWGPVSLDSLLASARTLEARRQAFGNPTSGPSQKRHLPLFDIEAEVAAMRTVQKREPGYDVLEGQHV